MNKIQIGIVDDHQLFSNALSTLIHKSKSYEVSFTAKGGEEFRSKILAQSPVPSIILMDINLLDSDGIQETRWLKVLHPKIEVLALSMESDHKTIIKMIQAGASGYLLKDTDPDQFMVALDSVLANGFYHSELVSNALLKKMNVDEEIKLKDHEKVFLNFVCSDKTYKQIAGEMYLSPKTIDKYRETLFRKFEVKSRTALALFSIKKGYVDLASLAL